MATVTRENIGLLNDKVTVQLAPEDYVSSFEKSLKSYAKNANIAGFRKGMVPSGLIKKMYGQSVFNEEVLRMVEKQLNDYMTHEQLDIFAQPLPLDKDSRALDMNNPTDYAFAFEIGLKPDVNVEAANIHVTKYKITVTPEMIEEEISRLVTRHGKTTEPETISNEEEVLNLHFHEADVDGNEVGDTHKDNSLPVKYFSKAAQERLMGAKKGDSFTIQLKEAFEEKEREWILGDLGLDKENTEDAEKFFNITITKIGFVEKAGMDETLFNAAYPNRSISNEEELRSAVKVDIETYFDQQSRNQVDDQIYHQLLDNTQLQFPDTFLKRWLQVSGEKEKTEEEAEEEYPTFSNQLKWTLISTKLMNVHEVKVEQEDIKNYARNQMLSYMGSQNVEDAPWLDEYANRMLQDKKFVEETYVRLQSEKLFNILEQEVQTMEESISAEDFAAKLHHHH